MKKILKFIKWITISFGVLIVIGLIYIHNLDFSLNEEAIENAFADLHYSPKENFIMVDDRTIHYVAIGDTSNPTVLFVHGSPGSWDNFLDFMRHPDLLNNFRLVSVDRPGFGKSESGMPERSLQQQAMLINSVLEVEGSSSILVGHSYGGPVIAKNGN